MLEKIKEFDFRSLDEKTQSTVKMGVIAIGVMGAIILSFVFYRLIVGKKLSFTQIENVMVRAATNYMSSQDLKVEESPYETIEITASTLAAGGYMKEMSKYTKKDVVCSGSVLVFRNIDELTYMPKLDCGEKYKYTNLVDVIKDEKNIVTDESGLYKMGTEEVPVYIYRGEHVNNYASFNGRLWRIVKIDENGNIKLIQKDRIQRTTWDDRFNINTNNNRGINEFEGVQASRIKDTILDSYNDEELFPKNSKPYIVPQELCINKRSLSESDNTGAIECSVKSELMGAGSIYLSEFFQASLDPNCQGLNSSSCRNYNYLSDIPYAYWTITGVADYTEKAYRIASLPSDEFCSSNSELFLTVVINGNMNFVSGDGTLEKPFMIK